MAPAEVLLEMPSLVHPNYEAQFTRQDQMLIAEGMSCLDAIKEAVCLFKPLFDIVCWVLEV